MPTVSPPNPAPIRSLEANPSYGPLTPRRVTECRRASGMFRPYALGFLALAIAIALWGSGYKLSRYDPHPSAASRASIAKLWDKRAASFPTNASSHGCRAHFPSGTQPPWLSIPTPHRKEAPAFLNFGQQESARRVFSIDSASIVHIAAHLENADTRLGLRIRN